MSEIDDSIDTVDAKTEKLQARINNLTISTNGFAAAMTRAFTQAASGGKAFDDILRNLALRISSLALAAAFKPIASGITGGLNSLIGGLVGGGSVGGGGGTAPPGNPTAVTAAMGAIKPFAAGGIIGTPTYFPLSSGGLGLAGEAGPEAIGPLRRGADGRLGISGAAGGGSITVQISTPDLASFRRSEAYLTGQVARAVARGQRSL